MAKIARQLTELIGHTPLLELTNYEKALGLEAKIIAKRTCICGSLKGASPDTYNA